MRCKICGGEEDPNEYSNKDDLEKHQLCSKCLFWHQRIEKDKKKRTSHLVYC